jgi:hypothetical protein
MYMQASAIGKNMTNAKTFLEKRYSDEMGLEDAVHTALLTLKEGFEGQVSGSNIEVRRGHQLGSLFCNLQKGFRRGLELCHMLVPCHKQSCTPRGRPLASGSCRRHMTGTLHGTHAFLLGSAVNWLLDCPLPRWSTHVEQASGPRLAGCCAQYIS